MAVENDTFKKSWNGSAVGWGSDREINSPINNIDMKRNDPVIGYEKFDMQKKSSNSGSNTTYSANMAISNVRPAGVSPTNAGSSSSTYNYVSTTSVSSGGGSETNLGGGMSGGYGGAGFSGAGMTRGMNTDMSGISGMASGMTSNMSRGMSGDMAMGMSGGGSYGMSGAGMSNVSGGSSNMAFNFPTNSQASSRQ